MNLYLIYSNEDGDYDTYDSAVVAAESVEAARLTHPSGKETLVWCPTETNAGTDGENWVWLTSWIPPHKVGVRHLGEALHEVPAGVICASFNAG